MDNPVYQFNQESWNAMGMDPEQQIDDQAYMALRLSKKLNEQVEIVAADLDKSAQSGFPVNFFKLLDNAELPDNYSKEMLSKSISPLLKRTIATNPERAGFFTGDQLEKWNAVMREAEEYARHQRYIDTVLDRIQREGSPGDDAFERRQSVNDMRKRQETWKQIQDQAQINKVINALDTYWSTDFRKENDSVLDARLEILNTMGIDTSMVDRDELRKTKGYQFREAVNLFGVLDAMENGDNLGWLIANKMTDGAAVDLLSHVDENSPLFVQEKALELLRKERYASMPETGMEKAFNSLFKSTSFMTEMALTYGLGEAFGLVKAGGAPMLDQLVKEGFLKFIRENGLKGFGQAVKEGVKRAGANTVGRLPVYLPSVTLNTFSEVAPSVVTIPDDFGNPSITVKESDVTDFIQRLVTNTVTQSIEMFTEELGPLIPLGDLDAKMITAFLPKTVRNFVAQSLIRNPTTRRIAERAILDRVPFDGLIGEFGEEVIGQFMMFGATLLGYGMGFRPENTAGTMSPIMSKEEAGDTLASIALQSVLFRGLQVAHAELTNRGAIAMIRDAQRAKSDRTHFEAMRDLISETRLPQSNVNEAERTLGLLLNGDAVVSVTPESLEGILQQATEGKTEAEANEARATLERLGVTTDAIENAKKNGTDVLLSRNRLWAVSSSKGFKNAKELVDRILDNEVSEVFGKTTKEITADGFTKEQIDEMVDRSKRQEDFLLDVQKTMSEAIRTAQKNAIAAGNKLGISQQNVQDFVNIYKWMANYLAENVETEEGLAKLKEMVDNLSVQFAEAPEKFDTTAAVSGVAQARVASLERRVADIQSSIDALNSMDYLNDTQISQLEALKDDLEEAQNELEAAKNGALNQAVPIHRVEKKMKQKKWAPIYEAYKLAEKMESEGADPKAIKLATGWENVQYGDMSNWLYELPDGYKPSQKLIDLMDGESSEKVDLGNGAFTFRDIRIPFGEAFEHTPELKALFSLYPELKKKWVVVSDYVDGGTAIASWDWFHNRFTFHKRLPKHLLPAAVAHEVQHFLQDEMAFDNSRDADWKNRPREQNAVDAAYRGTLSEGERRGSTMRSTSQEALDALISLQKEFRNNLIETHSSIRLFQGGTSAVTPEMEEEFVEAEKQGNYNEAQRLVDKAAGYDPKKATYPGDVAKVYHYGALGNDVFVADRPIHLGTEQAARERIPGKMKDDYVDSVEIYQAENGKWTWAEPNGMESGMYFSSEEAVRRKLSNSDLWLEGEELDGEAAKIHPYFISTENFKTVPDMIDQGGWDRAIAQAKEEGYRGIRYRNVVEDHGSWSYIVFNPEDMKLADPFTYDDNGNLIPLSERFNDLNPDVRYQGNTILKGQINLARFAQSQEAIISLFKDADASTLPHESAHWLKAAMESLVGAGFATDKMKQDLDTINAWLDKQDYTGAVTDQDKYRAREEYFARAFEQYLREGRFPEAATTGLKSALRRLARMLQSIYRNALALNAPIDDSIRDFFNDIFAVEEVVDGTSVLSGILREINTGALAFSKEDLKKLETAVAGAREDAETEAWLAALQDYQKGLKEQQKLWRNEAKEAYEASKAEQAYTYVRNGHKLDENFLRNVLKLDEETISILKKKRLTYKAAPVEAPVEAPANAETAEPAVEPAPTETPASAASAEAQEPVVLSGLVPDTKAAKEAWNAVGQNDVISIQDVDTLTAILYAIIKQDDSFGEKLSDVYTRFTGTYRSGGERYKATGEGKLYTKGLFESTVKKIIHNENVDAFKEEAKTDSLQAPIQGKDDGGKVRTVEDVTPDEVRNGAFEGEGLDIRVKAFNDYIATLKPGSFKREVAELLREFSMDEEEADFSVDDMLEAYTERHQGEEGVKGKTTFYDAVKTVRAELRKFMARDEYQQTLNVETPASILDTMKELGYGDVNDLITDLKTALGRSAFIKDYMNRKHAEYRNAFLDNPNWASEAGATRYLDAILRALKVTEGMKFSERARIAASEATRELMASANVRDVMNGERGVATSLRSNAAKVLRALKSGKEDKAAAITAALDMYRNDARLRAIRKLRADIQKTLNRAKRIGKSKPGSTLDGDTINAVKALLNRFGMSSAEPQWTTGPGDPQSVLAVMKEFTPDLEAELTHWSPWMNRVLTGEEAKTSWKNLTPEQFYELTDLIDYLRGEGRQSLMDQKGTFASNLRTAMEAILPSVEEHKTGDYTDPADKTMLQKLGSLARSGIHQMKTLVFMAHLLDGRTEFYGDHVIGPVRKFFQLPLSEGASRELFWYQKTSKEIMPHLQALMRSAKERNLLFSVNNPNNRSYTELRGETAAFVLLNAGAVENRQRLMESFGWSEDELNGLLAQFTKEDFEHAEAIWKSLSEMGQELAKVYYRERHYRMPWATPAPINLTLNDETEILSEGGYYPIAYTYHDSTQGYDPDIMNPFTKPNKPSRPTATFGRTPVLSDLSLLMSPAVVDRSIRENAHYIGMWEPLRMANAIWTNKDFKQAVIRNFSKETYDALKQLMDNVNNPDKGDKGLWKQVANKLGACLATTALGFKITTMAKQYASVTIGAERLGDYFYDAVSFALRDLRGLRRAVNKESPFMRDRYNLMDRDLRVVNTEFKKPIAKAADKYRYAAFWGLKQNDLNVAAVQWYAAFNWALDPKRGMTKDQARAYADDFVASTQGAARTIDTPVVQLETLGRLMTPFFGPACAAANTRLAGLSVFKQMDAGERIAFAVDNFLVPGLVMTLVAAVRGGLLHPDDDDDWDRIRKQSLIALLTEPVSGLPVVQDIADSVVRAAVTGRPVQSGVFEVSLFRPAEDVSREFVNMFRYWNELGYTTYAAASITGMLFGMPVVQVYEDYEKMILWNFGDKSSKPIKKQLQGEKRK